MMSSKENTNSNSSKFSEESENIDEDIPSSHQVCVLVVNISLTDSNLTKDVVVDMTKPLVGILFLNNLIG